MRTRVRVIFTLWLSIAASICAAALVYWLPLEFSFHAAFAVWVAFAGGLFAIWRTQPTFRRLIHWATLGAWPRQP